MHNPSDEILSEAIKSTQEKPIISIKPTPSNFKRHSAMLVAAVTAISLAGIAALISLKPVAYVGSRATQSKPDEVITVQNFIDSCQFHFEGCHNPQEFIDSRTLDSQSKVLLAQISQQYNLNPQVVLSIVYVENKDSVSPPSSLSKQSLSDIAKQLSTAFNTAKNPPKVYTHPTYGAYVLNKFNIASFALLNYFVVNSQDQDHFEQILAAPNENDPRIVGFAEVFNSLDD